MMIVETPPRAPLSNCTNSSRTTLSHPDLRSLKRRVSIEDCSSKKRPRVEQTVGYELKIQIPDDPMQGELAGGGHRNCTTFGALRAARMRMRPRTNFHSAAGKSQSPPCIGIDYTYRYESLL